jgi:hypothetical protein
LSQASSGVEKTRPFIRSKEWLCGQVAERSMAAGCKPAAPCELRGFESSPVHHVRNSKLETRESLPCVEATRTASSDFRVSKPGCGSNSVVESQPSKLLVAGSIPVSRSSLKFEIGESKIEAVGSPADFQFRFSPRHRRAGRCSSVGRARPW